MEESQAYGKELLGRISDLNSSLADSEREVKTLTAKLAANRSTEANRNVPCSAVKGNNAKTWTGQSELVHQAHAKEDLYSDLTGLIIRSIEQGDKEDVFDCLQTGRNGSKCKTEATVNTERYNINNFSSSSFQARAGETGIKTIRRYDVFVPAAITG